MKGLVLVVVLGVFTSVKAQIKVNGEELDNKRMILTK